MCEMLGGEYRHDHNGDGALAGGLPAARLVLLLDVGDAQNGLREAHQVQHGGDGTRLDLKVIHVTGACDQ